MPHESHHRRHGHGHGHGKREEPTSAPEYVYEWLWSCCYCGIHAAMSTFLDNCPGCTHTRCAHCPMELVKKSVSR